MNPGSVLVSGAAYDQLYGRSELALDFVGEQQVKNIDRAVRIYRAVPAGAPSASPRPIAQRPADQPVLAVLPFANLSGDPKWERLADGISGDIITDLTRLRDFLVIARNSSFAYKAKAVDVRQVGKELGVRYVLEGSLQASGEKVRVTAELVDATTGAHVWAARYERLQGDLFAIQDEVTEQVVNTIGGWVDASQGQIEMRSGAGRRPRSRRTTYISSASSRSTGFQEKVSPKLFICSHGQWIWTQSSRGRGPHCHWHTASPRQTASRMIRQARKGVRANVSKGQLYSIHLIRKPASA